MLVLKNFLILEMVDNVVILVDDNVRMILKIIRRGRRKDQRRECKPEMRFQGLDL